MTLARYDNLSLRFIPAKPDRAFPRRGNRSEGLTAAARFRGWREGSDFRVWSYSSSTTGFGRGDGSSTNCGSRKKSELSSARLPAAVANDVPDSRGRSV